MSLASEHLTHIEAFQSASDTLHFLKGVHLKTARSECIAHLLWGQLEVYVFLKPFIRNIHLIKMFLVITFLSSSGLHDRTF